MVGKKATESTRKWFGREVGCVSGRVDGVRVQAGSLGNIGRYLIEMDKGRRRKSFRTRIWSNHRLEWVCFKLLYFDSADVRKSDESVDPESRSPG
jgi:hypothetical protein